MNEINHGWPDKDAEIATPLEKLLCLLVTSFSGVQQQYDAVLKETWWIWLGIAAGFSCIVGPNDAKIPRLVTIPMGISFTTYDAV
jgi:hypothetical protein